MLAPAKINLALHVTGQRADGYHLLDSLVCFADIGDRLSVTVADEMTLTLTGPMAGKLTADADNLVLQAAHLLDPIKTAQITLEKILPVASGIGGGSSDAATCLRLLADLWHLPLPDPAAVLTLGADVPVCLAGGAARMQGIGETISPLSLPAFPAVLVNPGLSLSTPAVFQQLASKTNPTLQPPPTSLDHSQWLLYLKVQRNDLEAPAIALCPTIAEVLQALVQQSGCALARMSGAGATSFGLFETDAAARMAAQEIQARQPNWWVKPTRLA